VTILRVLAARPEYDIIRLCHRALFPPDGTVANNLSAQLLVRDALSRGLDASAVSDATDLALASLEISEMPDGPRRMIRGTLLEAVVETLLLQRSAAVRPEARFDGLDPDRYPNGESDRGVDVAVDEQHLELFECKIRVLDISQSDVDLLQDVAEAAASDSRACTPAFAGFYRNSVLSQVLATLMIRVPIYSADIDDLASLTSRRATTRVAL
jgi:hypothetical protein